MAGERHALQEAIALDPQNVFTRMFLCSTYLSGRQLTDALKTCDRALELMPGNVRLLCIKAQAYQGLGQLDQADSVLAGLRPAPGDALALSILSYQAVLQHRYAPAIDLLQSYLANSEPLGSKVGATRRWLGDLQRLSGDATGAKASYLQAQVELQAQLRTQPDNFELTAELGLVDAGLLDEQAALKHAQRAVALGLKLNRGEIVARIEDTQARIDARFGARDRAIAEIQHLLGTFGARPPLTPALLRLDPDWDGLRADPRFQRLIAANVATR